MDADRESSILDILLLFPPQWSPFQPSLSLPSLSAWLKRAGFSVSSVDLNVEFFEWLLSDHCAELLIRQVHERADLTDQVRVSLQRLFENVAAIRSDLHRMKNSQPPIYPRDKASYFDRHYIGVSSLTTYLAAISQVSQDFSVSPYEFHLECDNLSSAALERMVRRPPQLLAEFLRESVVRHVRTHPARSIGISCIGQEQLYFTLLAGSIIKEHTDVPVLVGGTILARIFERGSLKNDWFGSFFDIIVRNEGEKPAEEILRNLLSGSPAVDNVPGIVYLHDGAIESREPCAPLTPREIPVPDFDDMPLTQYLSAHTTLPLLASRGCYWGKCEFCHHGMVYGEKYAGYGAGAVLDSLHELEARYGVRYFAFNDEALPPKLLRDLGEMAPSHEVTGWNLTGLIKFENFFRSEDFVNLHRIGFRSLYVGLESASERVLRLMRKNTHREVIVSNLSAAAAAGIWMHCFLFFGFPGEEEADAQETFDFIVGNREIVRSFGVGTFSLEHNAPIFRHPERFGLTLHRSPRVDEDLDVYYAYDVRDGISAGRAGEWADMLHGAALDIPDYQAAGWIPRELLLGILAAISPTELIEQGARTWELGGLPRDAAMSHLVMLIDHPDEAEQKILINRVSGSVYFVRGGSRVLLEHCIEGDVTFGDLKTLAPSIFDRISARPVKRSASAELRSG
ncbi:radical SAM protein [Parafrankia sp. EUN1f]|uniref:B12-binding domain-containing radical SAM protein n=1 Tax=Parafrankia sp. EUN1f TaxID=102897 RepID=UPI0001C45F04|nr:Radical SAM domain protein [Parafrankia sp. EUN1f]